MSNIRLVIKYSMKLQLKGKIYLRKVEFFIEEKQIENELTVAVLPVTNDP